MELLNPLMLWGGLAIAIPIILHFWHQKKGKMLEWAATQWLTEKNLQQSRGIRLDNILLLLLRCLLLLLFCFVLSKPVTEWFSSQSSSQKIHLLQPNALVASNFRFELEEALKKGEKLYWIQADPMPVEDINQLPVLGDFDPLVLQTCLNKLSQHLNNEHLNLYFINSQDLTRVSDIFVPAPFSLLTVVDSTKQIPKPYLAFGNSKIFVNAANQLTSQTELDKNGKYTGNPILNAPVNALILNQDKIEKQTIIASLKALAEVYHLEINIDIELLAAKKYQWIFTSQSLPSQSNNIPQPALYIITNTNAIPNKDLDYQKNTIRIPYSLNPQSSESIFNGELPEWLGEVLVKYYGLNPLSKTLSNQQLQGLFKYAGSNKSSEESVFSKILLLAFIVILGIERFIAIRKNA